MNSEDIPSGSGDEPDQQPHFPTPYTQQKRFLHLLEQAREGKLLSRAVAEKAYESAICFAHECLLDREKETALFELAEIQRIDGKYSAAMSTLRRLLNHQSKTIDLEDVRVANTHMQIGLCQMNMRRLDEAMRSLRQAVVRFQCATEVDQAQFIECLCTQARIYRDARRIDQAKTAIKQAYRILPADDASPALQARVLEELAQLLYVQHRFSAAIVAFERVLLLKQEALGAWHPRRADSMSALAMCHISKHELESAEPLLLQASYIFLRAGTSERHNLIEALYRLSGVYRAQGRFREADAVELGADDLLGRASSAWKQFRIHIENAIKVEQLSGLAAAQTAYRKLLILVEPMREKQTPARIAILTQLYRIALLRKQELQADSLRVEIEEELTNFFPRHGIELEQRALRLARLLRLHAKETLADALYWLSEKFAQERSNLSLLRQALDEHRQLLSDMQKHESIETLDKILGELTNDAISIVESA